MTRFYSILCILLPLMGLKAVAQPVVSTAYMPLRVTDASLNMSVALTPADQAAPASGNNRTWDYTRFDSPGEVDGTVVKDQGQYTFPSPVNGADHVVVRGFDAPNFLLTDTAGLSIIGTDNIDLATVWDEYLYQRPRKLLPLGLQYQNTFGDSVLVFHRANSTYDTTVESYHAQYIGSGTLKVDGGTYANSILLHETSAGYVPNGTGWTRAWTRDAYLWYGTEGLGVPLAQLVHIVQGSSNFFRFDAYNQITATRPPQTSTAYLPTPARASLWANALTTTAPPSAGQNATWDYSQLQQSPQAPAVEVVYAPSSIFRPGVTDCNVALVVGGVGSPEGITYAKQSAAGLFAYGEAAFQGPATRYSNPLPLFPLPFVLGQTRYDSSLVNDSTAVSVRMQFAGTGTLKMVNAQDLPNTILLKVQRRTYSLSRPGVATMTDSSLAYEFYSPGRTLAPYTAREIFNTRFTPILSQTHGVEYTTDFVTEVQPTPEAGQWKISPNPARDRIRLSAAGAGTLYDAQGRAVRTFNGNEVDLSGLLPGLYRIRLTEISRYRSLLFVKE